MLATPEYLREIAALTSGNRDIYRNACRDAADEIERLQAELQSVIRIATDIKLSNSQ